MQPPFVMDKWIVGLQQNQRVDYTVNYEVSCFCSCGRLPHKIMQNQQWKWIRESCATSINIFDTKYPDIVLISLQNDVKSPKSTRHSCQVTWSLGGGQDEIKTVELVIETTPNDIDWNPRDKCASGNCFIYSLCQSKSFTAGQMQIMYVHNYKISKILFLKMHYVVLGKIIKRERASLTDFLYALTNSINTLCFHDWINKLILKDNTVSYWLLYLYFADPATYSADLIFLWEQLVYSVLKKNDISDFALLLCQYCKYLSYEFEFLHSASLNTDFAPIFNQCISPFSDIDPTWMYNVRQRQMMTQKSLHTTAAFTSSDARTLPQFLSAHESQEFSYAAAVRRSPNRNHSHVSSWIDSRSSSPTTSLSAKLSPLHLGSKGSSPSSTTSESASERDRERPLSAGAVLDHRRNNYFGNTLTVGGGQGREHAWTNTRVNYIHNKSSKTGRQPGRARSNSYSITTPQNRPPMIPGILSVTENPSEEKEGAKASDGGWIKVERQKRLTRQDNKQVRGRQRRGGRGGRGAAGRT